MTLGFGTKSDTKPVAVYDHTRLLEILAAEFAKDDARDPEWHAGTVASWRTQLEVQVQGDEKQHPAAKALAAVVNGAVCEKNE